MAKLPVLLTVIFLLFTLSHARSLTAKPDGTVTGLAEADHVFTTDILLPSKRHHFEPAKLLDFKHDAHADAASVTNSESDSGIGSVPLKETSFHSVNRHFPKRPALFPFRHFHDHNHRDCSFHKHFGSFNPRSHQARFVSNGNDIVASDKRSFDTGSRGVVRQTEARRGRFDDDGSAESKHRVDFMKHHLHPHEHHDNKHDKEHGLHHDREHEDNHKHHHKHHGGKEARDETEQHEGGGFIEKFLRLFIHV